MHLVSASPRDRVAYTRGKTEFIIKVTEQAKLTYSRDCNGRAADREIRYLRGL